MERILTLLVLVLVALPISTAAASESPVSCDGGNLVYSPVPNTTDPRPIACIGARDESGATYSWTRAGDTYLFTDAVMLDWSDCPDNMFCIFGERDYGILLSASSGTSDWINLGPGVNEAMSSWRNRRSGDVKWAYGTGGSGTVRCADSNSSLAFVGATDNNQASSIRLFSGETCTG